MVRRSREPSDFNLTIWRRVAFINCLILMIRTLSIAVAYELVEGLDRLVHCNMPCSDIDHSSGCSRRTSFFDTVFNFFFQCRVWKEILWLQLQSFKQPKSRATLSSLLWLQLLRKQSSIRLNSDA